MQISETNKVVIQCIIDRAEEQIKHATGEDARLIVMNSINISPIEVSSMDKLAIQLTNIWGIPLKNLSMYSRVETVVIRKQIFTMIYRKFHQESTWKAIAEYLGGYDHSTAMSWCKCGNDSHQVKDNKFMQHFEPVKHLYYAGFK